MFQQYLDITPEISEALENNQAVVALESTIISHGMPYPQNVTTARKVEKIIRENGAIPATIAIINGRIKIGLEEEALDFLGKSTTILKVSRRDFPYVISRKLHGATTVASTMIAASLAGIKVFVTGGIGGVHKGWQQNLDISADLTELANTNVAVVSAGVKSILDIGATLEYLETQGVPVLGFQTEEFPAFYSQKSGFSVDYPINSYQEAARFIKTKWDLKLDGGIVIGNPIPKQYEMEQSFIQKAISDALQEAETKQIKGKEITPFLLGYIKEITNGESLKSNIQLVYNNAKVGANIAVCLHSL